MTRAEYELNRPGIVEIDCDNVRHQLTQHRQFESTDPMVVVEGQGMRVRDSKGNATKDNKPSTQTRTRSAKKTGKAATKPKVQEVRTGGARCAS